MRSGRLNTKVVGGHFLPAALLHRTKGMDSEIIDLLETLMNLLYLTRVSCLNDLLAATAYLDAAEERLRALTGCLEAASTS